eukprot:scaffold1288_cov212-Pinguiococcus_pyrenoidosus.AAC.2
MTVLEHNSRHTAVLECQNVFRAQAQKVIAGAHPRSVAFASIEASLGRRTGCKALEADALVCVAIEVSWSQYHCTFRSSQCLLAAGRREGRWDRRGTAASPGCFQRISLVKALAIVVAVAAAKETKSHIDTVTAHLLHFHVGADTAATCHAVRLCTIEPSQLILGRPVQAQAANSFVVGRALRCYLLVGSHDFVRARAASEEVNIACILHGPIGVAAIAEVAIPDPMVVGPRKACIVSVPTRRKAGEGIADTTELHELVVAANVSALVAARHDGAMHVLSWQHARGTHFAIRRLHGWIEAVLT